MPEFNPYAPPVEPAQAGFLAPGPGGDQGYGVWREGDALVLPAQGTYLPNRCVVCNAPASHRHRQSYSWHPMWVYLMLLISLVVYIVAALLTRKTANLELPLCDAHRRRRSNGLLIGWGGSLGLLAVGIGGAIAEVPAIAVAGFLGMCATIIIGLLMARLVVPKKIDKTHAWMKVGKPFLDTVPASPMLPPPGTAGQLPPGGWGTPL